MDNGIGPTLREARNRRKVELSEVEAATKIRARYLQAIENEEWDALPGGAYTRGFIRTYASYLGLDGDRLADAYRRATQAGERVPKRIEPVPTGARRPRSRFSGRLAVLAVFAVLVAVLIGIGLAGGDGGGSPSPAPTVEENAGGKARTGVQAPAPAAESKVALELTATAEVWVCLLDAAAQPLLEGEILAPGESAGPFLSKRYEVAFGNGSVEMTVDGDPARIEESSGPVGYAVGPDGDVSPLEEGERPDCA